MPGAGTAPGRFSSPEGMAVDGDGNVYVADYDYHRVQKLSRSGEPLAQWGSYGTGPGQFVHPTGVAVDGDGNIYVAELGEATVPGRIQKLSPSGESLAQWGQAALGEFSSVRGVAVGRDGSVYFVPYQGNGVGKLTPGGEVLAVYSGPQAPGRWDPRGLALDGNGNIYVAAVRGVVKLSSEGELLSEFAAGEVFGVATDPEGNVYVPGQKLSSDGAVVAWGLTLRVPAIYGFARGIAVDPAGFVYVSYGSTNDIEKLSLAGELVSRWGAPPALFNEPRHIAVDKDGNLYVKDDRGLRLRKLSPCGEVLAQWDQNTRDGFVGIAIAPDGTAHSLPAAFLGFSGAALLAADAAGNLYIVQRFAGLVVKVSPTGEQIARFGNRGNDSQQLLSSPVAVAVDGDGALYVTDSNTVKKYAATGAFVSSWGGGGTGPGEFIGAEGLALDGQGRVYVADGGNHRIQVFTRDGELVAMWGERGNGPGEFQAPGGVAVDRLGAIYVADTGNNRVQKFNLGAGHEDAWTTGL